MTTRVVTTRACTSEPPPQMAECLDGREMGVGSFDLHRPESPCGGAESRAFGSWITGELGGAASRVRMGQAGPQRAPAAVAKRPDDVAEGVAGGVRRNRLIPNGA